jgi:hypothetical protein
LELFLAIVSVVAGCVSAIFFSNIRINDKSHSNMTYSGHRKYRQELDILQTEKSIVNGAITRVFEAFQKGKLDKVEFDRLMSKYNEESQMYEEKIKQIEPMADFSELKTLRGDLLHLVKEKINDIDMKLGEISKNNRIITNSITEEIQRKVSTHDSSGTIRPFRPRPFDSFLLQERKNLEQIETEIMQALEKLSDQDVVEPKTKNSSLDIV